MNNKILTIEFEMGLSRIGCGDELNFRRRKATVEASMLRLMKNRRLDRPA